MATPAAVYRNPRLPAHRTPLTADFYNRLAESIVAEANRRSITLTNPPLYPLADGDDLWLDRPVLAPTERAGFYPLDETLAPPPIGWDQGVNSLGAESAVVNAPAELAQYSINGLAWRIRKTSQAASTGTFVATRTIPKPTVTGTTPVSICIEFANTTAYPVRFRVRGRSASGTFTTLASATFTAATPAGERQLFIRQGVSVPNASEDIVLEVRVGDGTSRTGRALLYLFDYMLVFGLNLASPTRQGTTLTAAGNIGRLLTSCREIGLASPPAGNLRYDGTKDFTRSDYRDRYIRVPGMSFETAPLPFYPDSHEAFYWMTEKVVDRFGASAVRQIATDNLFTRGLFSQSSGTARLLINSVVSGRSNASGYGSDASIPISLYRYSYTSPGLEAEPAFVYAWKPNEYGTTARVYADTASDRAAMATALFRSVNGRAPSSALTDATLYSGLFVSPGVRLGTHGFAPSTATFGVSRRELRPNELDPTGGFGAPNQGVLNATATSIAWLIDWGSNAPAPTIEETTNWRAYYANGTTVALNAQGFRLSADYMRAQDSGGQRYTLLWLSAASDPGGTPAGIQFTDATG